MALKLVFGDKTLSSVNVKGFDFKTSVEENSSTRTSDFTVDLKVTGIITDSTEDVTIELAKWSLVGNATEGEGIRPVELIDTNTDDENAASVVVVRKYNLPNCFVVSYDEAIVSDATGRTFTAHLRQVKSLSANASVEGSY